MTSIRRVATILVLAVLSVTLAGTVRADVVTNWNVVATTAAATPSQQPPPTPPPPQATPSPAPAAREPSAPATPRNSASILGYV